MSGRENPANQVEKDALDGADPGAEAQGDGTAGPASGSSTPPSSRAASFLPTAENITNATSALLSSLSTAPSAIFSSLYGPTPAISSAPTLSPSNLPPSTPSTSYQIPPAQPSALRTLILPHTQRMATVTANAAPNILAVARHLVRGSGAPDELGRAAKTFAAVAEVSVSRTETSLEKISKDLNESGARWTRLMEQGSKELDGIGRDLDYSGKMWPKK